MLHVHNHTLGPGAEMPSGTNYGPELLISVWTMMAFSILVVASRTASNYKFGNLQLSDVIILLALTLLLIAAVLFNVAVNHGYGNTSTAPSHRSVTASFRYSTIGYAIVILAATAGRLAMIMYMMALLAARTWDRMVLWTLVPLQVIVNVVSVVLLFAQCSRVQDIFQPGAQEQCMSLDVQIDYGYFQGAFNSASDLFLAVFPIYIFWRFNWTLRVKLVLISLLSLGVVAMAASLVKTLEYPTILKSTNPRINRVPLLRWMFIEAGIVLITASVPCIRPLVIHWVRKYIRKKQTQHHQMDGEPVANQSTENFAADWKMSWIMPYVRQRGQGQASCSSEEHERQILANITTQIFAGDREFLDRHVGGIVRKVEVVVVADEIPLTTRRDSGI
ncbi:hypothetical protein BO86DRAFT_425420 [Aspergillus japonicus CBS 114.51]|uniref:Rhodopsin domain-containing protein n=2 Tax=Aspergillus TaxID=5052 RepID=A0A2V5HVH1_ASPV1|nr:hypothetical protein BO86DRAFT_425420 [Aspergillus japonicus CBS 114.51]PYI20280.1 hypothetical protein BO99DRAFT_456734 [Aspergillus violaceofuscus CBS 115571]RAH76236.1 hypothetical protein BO86DRAFT_425420 [Aspergillus japonicus CBS 114.51]